MTLTERLTELVRAGFAGIAIQSYEPEEAIEEITKLCRDQEWRLATWDVDAGLHVAGLAADVAAAAGSGSDPLTAVRSLRHLADPNHSALLILRNFHRFLGSVEIIQAIERQLQVGKQSGGFIVLLSPLVQLPVELERKFVVVEHALPDREQLTAIARGVATQPGETPEGDSLAQVLDAAAGMTRMESENAFSLSLVRRGTLAAEELWELKAQTLAKEGLLTLYRGGESFHDLGGLTALKDFCLRALRRIDGRPAGARPRGVLLLGCPGTGKSAFAKALGNETGRPTIVLDIGALLGGVVGQTEANVRKAFRSIDAMAPCIVFVDEIEKGLSGAQASGQTDSGVSARLFGSLLTWLNDHTSDVFFIATANDVSKLPPEFARAERFDGIFFLDLPGDRERAAVWRMYREKFGLDGSRPLPQDRNWTGAEIKACCRLAALLGIPLLEAASNIVPVANTASEAVERLRTWASGRCLDAEQPGVFQRDARTTSKHGRRVTRDPSVN
jgi:hypothetical protein